MLCHICGKVFQSNAKLKRHLRVTHSNEKHPCSLCDKVFKNKSSLTKHVVQVHTKKNGKKHLCKICGADFDSKDNLHHHLSSQHSEEQITDNKGDQSKPEIIQDKNTQTSFNGSLTVIQLPLQGLAETDYLQSFADNRENIILRIGQYADQRRGVRYYIHLAIRFVRLNSDGEITETVGHFNTTAITILNSQNQETEIRAAVNENIFKIHAQVMNFTRESSGYFLHHFTSLNFHYI